MASDHDVFESGQIGEEPDVLESATDAARSDPVRLEPGEISSVEKKAAAVGGVEPGEQVEERGFSGAVRAYQPEDLPARNRKTDVDERLDAAKALA